ncbi:MAG: Rnase Y domain-containing protein, partial [Gemmatimonadota bacterium]
MELLIGGIASLVAVVAGVAAGRGLERRRAARLRETAEEAARGILSGAEREAETLRRSAELAGKEEGFRLRDEQLREVEERRLELEKLEKRVAEREESLERKLEALDTRQERVALRE